MQVDRAIPNVTYQCHRSWSLSQEANKLSGACSAYRATRQLPIKDGTVHNHGLVLILVQFLINHHLVSPSCRFADSQSLADAGPVVDSSHNTSTSRSTSTRRQLWTLSEHKVIKHIPKSARSACAAHLAGILRDIVARPDNESSWVSLFNWSGYVLQPPKRSGKRHNVGNDIKKRISEFVPTSQPSPTSPTSSIRQAAPPTTLLSHTITSKLEDVNIRATIRLLCSDDTLAALCEENLGKLQALSQIQRFCRLCISNHQY